MNKRKITYLIVSLVILVTLMSACAAPVPAPAPSPAPAPAPAPAPKPEMIELTHASYCPATGTFSLITQWWDKEVYVRSGGQIRTTNWLWAGALLKADNILKGIGEGLADYGFVSGGYCQAELPLATANDIVCTTEHEGAKELAYLELWDSYAPIREEFERNNVIPVHFYPESATVLAGTGEPVKKLEDFKRLKCRGYSMLNDVVGALGALPIAMSAADLYVAIEKGTINSFTGQPPDALESFKTSEQIDWIVNPGWGVYAIGACVMNLDKYNSLPDDIKKLIADMQKETIIYGAGMRLQLHRFALVAALARDVEIYMVPEDEKKRWKEKLNPDVMFAEWLDKREAEGHPAREWRRLVLEKLPAAEQETPDPGLTKRMQQTLDEFRPRK